MLAAIAELGLAAWPLALMFAVVGRRRSGARREGVNRALHELRRPLQAMLLARRGRRAGPDQLDLAIAALAELDRAVNGGRRDPLLRPVAATDLVQAAIRRWRAVAGAGGREITLSWSAGASRVSCDEVEIARALDNLLANAVEHGGGTIRLDGRVRRGRLRLLVANGARGARGAVPLAHRFGAPTPACGRGRGLRLAAEIARRHGGRLAAWHGDAGGAAVLELPLAE